MVTRAISRGSRMPVAPTSMIFFATSSQIGSLRSTKHNSRSAWVKAAFNRSISPGSSLLSLSKRASGILHPLTPEHARQGIPYAQIRAWRFTCDTQPALQPDGRADRPDVVDACQDRGRRTGQGVGCVLVRLAGPGQSGRFGASSPRAGCSPIWSAERPVGTVCLDRDLKPMAMLSIPKQLR